MCLLDSFGTAKTYLCSAASRFSLLVTLEYDLADLLVGASLQVGQAAPSLSRYFKTLLVLHGKQ